MLGIELNPEKKASPGYLCLFINTYYPQFISEHYRNNPELSSKSYLDQKESLQNECFGDSDFYSTGLKKTGWRADDLIVNCLQLQDTWAKENDFEGKGTGLDIAVEQIAHAKPDVVYLQDLSLATTDFIASLRQHAELIVGQIASPVPSQTDLGQLDIIFSSFPHFVERFREAGITSYYQPLAFDSRVLKKIGDSEKKFPVTFVGGITPVHQNRKDFFETLARFADVDFWGYGSETLPQDSPILKKHHGEAWGIEMFSVLSRSRLTINNHIDSAENFANNMRLFEATGCGALLITDYKDNLNELFDIGEEIVAYRTVDECYALVKYFLSHQGEAEKIARSGRERTLRDHTYSGRMEKTAEILERHLRYSKEKGKLMPPDLSKISYGHEAIKEDEATDEMTSAWKSPEIPMKQRALVQRELEEMYKGKPPTVFRVLAETLQRIVYPDVSILEIGCASGYYYEILEYLLNLRVQYTGVDYSRNLIGLAKNCYPQTDFLVADGSNLPFGDRCFDISISSCILLHTPNYPEHIVETARVSRRYVVAHRTPVCRKHSTQYFKKFAYGVETVELLFNEEELLSEFRKCDLRVLNSNVYFDNPTEDRFEVTYLFERKA